MMNTVAEANDFQTLTINNLKVHINAEHNAFVKGTKITVMDHY